MLFTLYVMPLAKIISLQGVNHTQYAADVQLYIRLNDSKVTLTLRDCFVTVQRWLDANGLSMNPNKTKSMGVGTAARQRTEGDPGSIAQLTTP